MGQELKIIYFINFAEEIITTEYTHTVIRMSKKPNMYPSKGKNSTQHTITTTLPTLCPESTSA